jgi:hypothetical protein
MPVFLKRSVGQFLYSKRSSQELVVVLFTIVLCFVSAYTLLKRDPHSLLYYGDAVSHLVISRSVFDSIQPGMGQLGGVWLPLNHLMLMPFVTNDFLFHTGLAGTIVSTLSVAVTACTLLRIVKMEFNSSLMAGFLSAILYLMNPSVIYMGIVPMLEAPFMMFFVLSVYYLQKVCYYYICINSNTLGISLTLKVRILLVKCALAISASTIIRYEAWLLPIAFIIVLMVIKFFRKNETWRPRICWFVSLPIILSFSGILFWLIWNFVYYKDPFFFATGPYSAHIQGQPFSEYLHLNPHLVLSILTGVSKAMYGIPVLIIAIFGVILYLYLRRNDRSRLVFFLLTTALLTLPFLSIFSAMVQGSGVIYPIEEGGWFNGRYLVTISPLLAFCSVSLIMFVNEKMRSRQSVINGVICGFVVLIVLVCYIYTVISQPLRIGGATVLSDKYALLPFLKRFQFAFDTGDALRKLLGDKRETVVLFTPSQSGQQIALESGLPLKSFIDVGSGSYWSISKSSPWTYGEYLVIRKPTDIHQDPKNNLIGYWIRNQQLLMKYYHVAYENPYFMILKK